MIDADPDLGRPLEHADAYLRAEVAFAVTHEGALHLEDILQHRVRLEFETRDRGAAAAEEIADDRRPPARLGRDHRRRRGRRPTAGAPPPSSPPSRRRTDAAAEAVRRRAADLVPMA